MVKDKQFKIEEENIKENGFSIINFLLIVIVIIASYFAYDMLSKNVDTKISTANAIVFSNETNIKANTAKKDKKILVHQVMKNYLKM